MNNVHPIFKGLIDSMTPNTEEKKNRLLHDAIVKFLSRAYQAGLSIRGGQINGWHFVGPDAADWDVDMKYLAISQGANVQEMPIDMNACIEESGIEANLPTPQHPLQGFADWLIAGKPQIDK